MEEKTEYVVSMIESLFDVPRGNGDDIAIREVVDDTLHDIAKAGVKTLTYEQLRSMIHQFSEDLVRAGAQKSDVICSAHRNSIEFIVAYLATTWIGATAAPLNASYLAEEFRFFMSDTNAKAILLHQDQTPEAQAAAKQLGIPVWFTEDNVSSGESPGSIKLYAPESASSGKAEKSSAKPDQIGMFLHTSGTTSKPKGVPLTQKNIACSLQNIAKTYELTSKDTTLLVMPLFHVHGLIAAALSTLASGGCVVIPPNGRFSASNFWPIVMRFNVTWYTAVPTIHQVLLSRAEKEYPKDSKPNLRFIRSCSSSLAPAVLSKLEEAFDAPVLEAYGMTEAAHQMSSNPLPKYGPRKPGTVGVGQGVEIVILNDVLEKVAAGVEGEVCIRGDNVTHGYHNNEAANKEGFAGGYFHTGDQGVLDADGYLRLTGRIKELINRGGEKISPLELDAALLAHPGVVEAVAFAAPDEKYGEIVNAAVILHPDHTGKVSEEDIKSFVATRLAKFKVPSKIFISETLPKTATGKVQRRIVAAHFLENKA
mmetsp:Transcript_8438/g.15270  ORF Transcript_8438/g.15270 Transcript_8438/m.15270 type:complete len:537 (-) Transcript_8438:1745-3355(-)